MYGYIQSRTTYYNMYSMRRNQQYKKHTGRKFFTFIIIVAMIGSLYNLVRPLPQAKASVVAIDNQVNSVQLKWPTTGTAAFGAQGFGVLATHGAQTPRPTASIAKIITVLAILEKHPIKPGQQGPSITMTKNDVDLFNKYFGMGGSYVKVEEGEKITEYQALQAILLPSANNMADSMAIWSFGSMDNYLSYANGMVKSLGRTKTTPATDASGFSPNNTSIAAELVRLGELAMAKPVIAEIVAQKSATIPVHGVIYSANSRLGYNHIIGIKTGLTDQAGGCFLFAAKYDAGNGKEITLVGAIMGEPNLKGALDAASPLLDSAKPYFTVKTPIKAGETFATLTTPWLTQADVVARSDVSLVTWQGSALKPSVELSRISRSLPASTQVGTAVISSGNNTASTPLVLKQNINGPTWKWRLKRLD
jgi:D-alanyl-D-alanine carboxypeptidase (penicillin-binding protein 5/6)